MSKKHQHIISKKSTRSKAQRSWRRKAKTGLKKDKAFKRLPKLRKVPKSGIPKENETKQKSIGSIGENIDSEIYKKLTQND